MVRKTETPTVSMPPEMVDEIERRREKGTSRSEYIREAIQARIDAEDRGSWDDLLEKTTDGDGGNEATADA